MIYNFKISEPLIEMSYKQGKLQPNCGFQGAFSELKNKKRQFQRKTLYPSVAVVPEHLFVRIYLAVLRQ